MPQLTFRQRAEDDLRDIFLYIAEGAPSRTLPFIASIKSVCEKYASYPHLGHSRPELHPKIRSFPFANYVIFYVSLNDGIEVVRVLNGTMDIEDLM